MPVCWCCREDVDFAGLPPGSAFLQSLCVGEMSQVSEFSSCEEVSARPDIQSHRAPTRTADEMRLRLRRSATGRNMRAHFTICAKQPAGSDLVDPRRRNSQVKRGRPQGPRMRCGWGCG